MNNNKSAAERYMNINFKPCIMGVHDLYGMCQKHPARKLPDLCCSLHFFENFSEDYRGISSRKTLSTASFIMRDEIWSIQVITGR